VKIYERDWSAGGAVAKIVATASSGALMGEWPSVISSILFLAQEWLDTLVLHVKV
jgi:hypothetical protein